MLVLIQADFYEIIRSNKVTLWVSLILGFGYEIVPEILTVFYYYINLMHSQLKLNNKIRSKTQEIASQHSSPLK